MESNKELKLSALRPLSEKEWKFGADEKTKIHENALCLFESTEMCPSLFAIDYCQGSL